jgi:hypothetical protein
MRELMEDDKPQVDAQRWNVPHTNLGSGECAVPVAGVDDIVIHEDRVQLGVIHGIATPAARRCGGRGRGRENMKSTVRPRGEGFVYGDALLDTCGRREPANGWGEQRHFIRRHRPNRAGTERIIHGAPSFSRAMVGFVSEPNQKQDHCDPEGDANAYRVRRTHMVLLRRKSVSSRKRRAVIIARTLRR